MAPALNRRQIRAVKLAESDLLRGFTRRVETYRNVDEPEADAAERWAVYETIDGKTRVWRESVTNGYSGAIKKTESECGVILQLAQWSHADDVARANRARTARGLEPIGPWAKYECKPYR